MLGVRLLASILLCSPDWPEDRTDRPVPLVTPPMTHLRAFPTLGLLVFLLGHSLLPPLLGSRVSVRLRRSSPCAAHYSGAGQETL